MPHKSLRLLEHAIAAGIYDLFGSAPEDLEIWGRNGKRSNAMIMAKPSK
jgi:hypothetical protein